MLRVQEETAFIGISELRKEMPVLLRELERGRVVLTRRNKPVGVILNYPEYERLERIFELLEDLSLGYVVRARIGSRRKFISLDEAERRVGLK